MPSKDFEPLKLPGCIVPFCFDFINRGEGRAAAAPCHEIAESFFLALGGNGYRSVSFVSRPAGETEFFGTRTRCVAEQHSLNPTIDLNN